MCRASFFEYAQSCFVSNDDDLASGKDSAGKNPQSKKSILPAVRSGDRPPDLDEIWKRFSLRIGQLFSKNNNKNSSSDNKNVKLLVITMLISIAMMVYAGSGIFFIMQGQTGVVMRFGHYITTVGHGLHWRLPYPFGWHEVVNTTQLHTIKVSRNNLDQLMNSGDSLILTRDSSIVDIGFSVEYKIFSAIDYLLHSANSEHIILHVAQSAVNTIVSTQDADDIFRQDLSILQRQLIDIIQKDLDHYKTGIKITGVTVHHIDVPNQIKIEKIKIKNAKNARKASELAAQVYVNNLLQNVNHEAMKMIDDAKLYSEDVISHANGDAERFKKLYKQYLKTPEVIRKMIYLETMQEIYSNLIKIYIENNGTMLYLPIDKIAEKGKKSLMRKDISSGKTLNNSVSTSISSINVPDILSENSDSVDELDTPSSCSLRDRVRNRSRITELP
ncbi:MAG: FtsH protease activity modulator HflK [Burkholderia sp.]|nr:FtsH protease activity modulator HflK [Burkholderia sp.]